MFVVIGTTVVRKAAFAFDNFMKNQKEIQDRYPQSRLVVATDEPDFVEELKEYLRKYSVEGDVITYETEKPDYARTRIWSIACGREAIRKYTLNTDATYLLSLDTDMTYDPAIIDIMKEKIKGYDVVQGGFASHHKNPSGASLIVLGGWTYCLIRREILEKVKGKCYEFKNHQVLDDGAIFDRDLIKLRAKIRKGIFLKTNHYRNSHEANTIEPQNLSLYRRIIMLPLFKYILVTSSIILKHDLALLVMPLVHPRMMRSRTPREVKQYLFGDRYDQHMRLAIVSREYPPDSAWGGVATVYHNLALTLSRQGYEVHIICQAVGKPKDYVDEGVFVHRVGTNPKRYSALGRINFTIHAWLKLRKIIKDYSIEIVETPYWSAEGFLYSFHKQTPLVISIQSSARDTIRTKTYSGMKELLGLKAMSLLADFTARRADRIVANSQVTCNKIVKEARINPRKIELIHYAIDTHRFRFVKSTILERLQISSDTHIALFIGRLEARKGVHILCQALPDIIRSLPSTKLILVGRDTNSAPSGGSFKDYIIRKAKEYDFRENLIFADFLPEDKLIELYSACDVFVFPSLYESFGLPTIEAMACGKPVVATSTGVASELESLALKGLEVIPAGNAQKLAEATIKMLLLTEEDKKQVARENRELIEKQFSIPAYTDKMVEFYKSVSR